MYIGELLEILGLNILRYGLNEGLDLEVNLINHENTDLLVVQAPERTNSGLVVGKQSEVRTAVGTSEVLERIHSIDGSLLHALWNEQIFNENAFTYMRLPEVPADKEALIELTVMTGDHSTTRYWNIEGKYFQDSFAT